MLRDEEIQRIAEECDGDECDQSQTTRFARAVERAAYERAADTVHHLSEYPPEHIAKVIRALGRQ